MVQYKQADTQSEQHEFLYFSHKCKVIPNCCREIIIGNNAIKRVEEVKYLGVTLDEKLSWNKHVKLLKEKLVKVASSFKLIKHYVPHKAKKINK